MTNWYAFNHNEVVLAKADNKAEAQKEAKEYTYATCNPGYVKSEDNLNEFEQASVDDYNQRH